MNTETDLSTGPHRSPGSHGRPPRIRRRKRRNWKPHIPRRPWSRITGSIAAILVILTSVSIGHALTYPGGGSFSARIAEWARDHHMGALVTFGEWLTYSPPQKGGKPSFALTGPTAATQRIAHEKKALAALYGPPPRLKSFAGHPLPGEGVWRVLGVVDGHPAMYGTDLRPSSVYSSYVAGIVEMNQSLLKFQLRPGTEDPGPGDWHAQSYITPGTRHGLLATFNSGFKIDVSGGGFYLNGTRRGTLTKGVASEVYYKDGHIAIGNWGGTLHMSPQVAAVRQNLHLIVQNGQIPSSVDNNVEGSWGATLGGGYYVWRSGIGITKTGRIVFAYGPALNVRELAQLLKRAGAVTAMQLDINPDWMSFMYYLNDMTTHPRPVNMLPDQVQPPNRYYSPASRDFTAVYAR